MQVPPVPHHQLSIRAFFTQKQLRGAWSLNFYAICSEGCMLSRFCDLLQCHEVTMQRVHGGEIQRHGQSSCRDFGWGDSTIDLLGSDMHCLLVTPR